MAAMESMQINDATKEILSCCGTSTYCPLLLFLFSADRCAGSWCPETREPQLRAGSALDDLSLCFADTRVAGAGRICLEGGVYVHVRDMVEGREKGQVPSKDVRQRTW